MATVCGCPVGPCASPAHSARPRFPPARFSASLSSSAHPSGLRGAAPRASSAPEYSPSTSGSDANQAPAPAPRQPRSNKGYQRVPVFVRPLARTETESGSGGPSGGVLDVPLASIKRPFKLARPNDKAKVAQLASSIKDIGLQVPVRLLVRVSLCGREPRESCAP